MPRREDVKALRDDVRVIESTEDGEEKMGEGNNKKVVDSTEEREKKIEEGKEMRDIHSDKSDEMIQDTDGEGDDDNGWIEVRKKRTVKALSGVQEIKEKSKIFAKSEKVNLANLCSQVYLQTIKN